MATHKKGDLERKSNTRRKNETIPTAGRGACHKRQTRRNIPLGHFGGIKMDNGSKEPENTKERKKLEACMRKI